MDEVKKALHVDTDIDWKMCNMKINLKYKAASNSTYLYPEFFDAGLDVLIFSGNTDAAVPGRYTNSQLADLAENYGVEYKTS